MSKNFSSTYLYVKDWEDHHQYDINLESKTYASTFIYSKTDTNGRSTENMLVEFILKSSNRRLQYCIEFL